MHECKKCKQEKPRSEFGKNTRIWWCWSCCRERHAKPNPCGCSDCQWHGKKMPLQRWRIQACGVLGISPTGAKLMDVAEGVANLYGDPVPGCAGKAWSYLAEKYVP